MILEYLTTFPAVQFIVVIALTAIVICKMMVNEADRSAERRHRAEREKSLLIEHQGDALASAKKPKRSSEESD